MYDVREDYSQEEHVDGLPFGTLSPPYKEPTVVRTVSHVMVYSPSAGK